MAEQRRAYPQRPMCFEMPADAVAGQTVFVSTTDGLEASIRISSEAKVGDTIIVPGPDDADSGNCVVDPHFYYHKAGIERPSPQIVIRGGHRFKLPVPPYLLHHHKVAVTLEPHEDYWPSPLVSAVQVCLFSFYCRLVVSDLVLL